MMKRTTFVADSCTLVLWGSFFHLASPGHIVKRLVLLSLSLLISVFFVLFFVRLFGWLLVLAVWCPWISGDGSDSLDTLLAWLRPDEPISQYCLLSGYPSLSRASVFYFCFDQIKTTSSPSWTRLHQCHVTLLDEATSCWLGVNKVKTFPHVVSNAPLCLLNLRASMELSLRGKQTGENYSPPLPFFLISASLGVFRGQRVNGKPPVRASASLTILLSVAVGPLLFCSS